MIYNQHKNKNMTRFAFFFSMLYLLICFACTPESNSSDASTTTTSNEVVADEASPSASTNESAAAASTETSPSDNTVVSWVENLNIRQQPNLKSKVVASAKENDVLTLTGEKSDFTETIELRGTSHGLRSRLLMVRLDGSSREL